MYIGIIGTTSRAQKLAAMFAKAGHDISVSDPVAPQRAQAVASQLGGLPVEMPYKQAIRSDVLVLATDWSDVDKAVAQLGVIRETVVIDASTPYGNVRGSGAQLLAAKLNTAHLVEVFPRLDSTVSIVGDDPHAKAVVIELFRSCGVSPTDAGVLAVAGVLEKQVLAA